ncbi:WbqC family protein [Curvibacter sp. HBC61]|uniref:WbqC family protein n=1 Tax=Curvibacter cyanobacteriorum TaxID=3026422 RepID=A0ABT5N200_9BURK|nr:WbqC family protein [Curvibacter sp. HBC61]MDD0840122.1 WbqC family protein [Curvibacter sp. HBC61]
MKRVALMQPYLYPYLGYFQLMHHADVWISHDDVQYTKGWCNKNRLWDGQQPKHFSLPLKAASSKALIKDRQLVDLKQFTRHQLADLHRVYRHHPFFDEVHGYLSALWQREAEVSQLSAFLHHTLFDLARGLGLQCQFLVSSDTGWGGEHHAQDRVLAICERAGASHYLNAPGGRALYDPQAFEARGLQLGFLRPVLRPFPQARGGQADFGLSIIDTLFNLGFEQTRTEVTLGAIEWVTH